MKIVADYPPNWSAIKQHFGNVGTQIIVTYGDTIYNPFNQTIRPDLEAHEEVHMRQQGKDPDAYFKRYFSDIQFRLDVEAEAYAVQAKALRKKYGKNGEAIVAKLLDVFAGYLASPVYGNISKAEALERIRKFFRS